MTHDQALDRLIQLRLDAGGSRSPEDPGAQSSWPVLWSFLTRTDADPTHSKDPAAVTIRMGLGGWLVSLTDPSLQVTLTVGVEHLEHALDKLEETIRSPYASWSPWKGSSGKFSKKSKGTAGQPQNGE